MKIVTGKKPVPRRILLYGVHGVGKSTWAADAPECLFLNIEDGLDDIDCQRTEQLKTWTDVITAIEWLLAENHSYRWVAIDTLDWLEKLIWKQVADDAGKASIADIGYGNGYKQAVARWQYLLKGFERLRKIKGCGIIALAHANIKRFDSPEQDSYDRYQPALHETASALWQEWCDEVLFASYRVFVRKEDQGFNKERSIAVGEGERYLRTKETAAVLAKNRLGLPAELPFEWSAYARHLGNINGIVKEGSSKVSGKEKQNG